MHSGPRKIPLLKRSALFLSLALTIAASQERQHTSDYRSMEKKIAYLKQNADRTPPDPKPTDITEAEANAYLKEGGVKLPKGVNTLTLAAQAGIIYGHAQVDFDAITQKARSSNPLLGVFSGLHDVHVVAQASGMNHTGTITVQHVYLDNVEMPQIALQFFVERYVKPKYPNVGITSTFPLPLKIETATVEAGRVQLVQK